MSCAPNETHSPGLRSIGDRPVVVGEIVGVGAAAVPDGHEHAILAGAADTVARSALADTIDRHFPGRHAPAVDRIAGIGPVIGAVHPLQRGDVVHHQRLRIAPGLVRIAARERIAWIGPIGHHRIFERVPIGAECRRLMTMLEAERVPGLVKHAGPGIIALHGSVEIGLVEPEAARLVIIARIVSMGRPGRVRHRIAVGTVPHLHPQGWTQASHQILHS